MDLDVNRSVILFDVHDCDSLVVRSHIQTRVQTIQMARKTEADKMIVFGRH